MISDSRQPPLSTHPGEPQSNDATTDYVTMQPWNESPYVETFGDEEGDDEEHNSIAPSIASSVITADGIHDMTGFNVVCLVILIGDMSRWCVLPNAMASGRFSGGGSTVTLGYAVAAFSGRTYRYKSGFWASLVNNWIFLDVDHFGLMSASGDLNLRASAKCWQSTILNCSADYTWNGLRNAGCHRAFVA
jgi:hypothetical protein